MALNYVNLTVDLYDGQGNPLTSGVVTFTPSATLVDPGVEIVPTMGINVALKVGGPPVVKLLATDNGSVTPSGWGWVVTYSNVPGNPAQQTILLPFASGSNQFLSSQVSVPVVTANVQAMPLPTGTPTAGQIPVATGSGDNSSWTNQNSGGLFGDGSDGPLTFDGVSTVAGIVPSGGTYTLVRDLYGTSLTINNGVTVNPHGYRFFCMGTFTNNGTVTVAGANASGAAGAGATGSAVYAGGRAGAAGATGAGGNAAGFGGGVSTGSNQGNGGGGGAGTSGAGGTGATATNVVQLWWKTIIPLLTGVMSAFAATVGVAGGQGGGGGGGDGTNSGGGGGSGGGVVAIFAWAIVNAGIINASGGNGNSPTVGNVGGGGGGGGGLIVGVSLSVWSNTGTMNVAPGSGGTLHGAGSANGTGGNAGQTANVVVM